MIIRMNSFKKMMNVSVRQIVTTVFLIWGHLKMIQLQKLQIYDKACNPYLVEDECCTNEAMARGLIFVNIFKTFICLFLPGPVQ